MKISILIISKNRKEELAFTLNRLKSIVDVSVHEVLVLLDGCNDDSEEIINQFDWVNWTVLNESIGASRARNFLYKKAIMFTNRSKEVSFLDEKRHGPMQGDRVLSSESGLIGLEKKERPEQKRRQTFTAVSDQGIFPFHSIAASSNQTNGIVE